MIAAMNLLDLLKPGCIRVPTASVDRHGIIDELVDLVAGETDIDARGTRALREAVWAREQTRSTGIGMGLAIPHGKTDLCDQLLIAVGKPEEPVDFKSIDGKPVELVILLISPHGRTSEHIQTLARISRLMTMDEFRNAVYAAETADEIFRLFEQYESSEANA